MTRAIVALPPQPTFSPSGEIDKIKATRWAGLSPLRESLSSGDPQRRQRSPLRPPRGRRSNGCSSRSAAPGARCCWRCCVRPDPIPSDPCARRVRRGVCAKGVTNEHTPQAETLKHAKRRKDAAKKPKQKLKNRLGGTEIVHARGIDGTRHYCTREGGGLLVVCFLHEQS